MPPGDDSNKKPKSTAVRQLVQYISKETQLRVTIIYNYDSIGQCIRSYYIQYSTVTNVNDVSLLVDHDVAIVSVLKLKEIAHQRVGSHAYNELVTGLCARDVRV